MFQNLKVSVGIGIGSLVYDLIKLGFNGSNIDWYRAPFVTIFSLIVLTIVTSLKKSSDESE